MKSLKDKIFIRKVKEALAQLPKGSGSAASNIAYDETMNRIRGQEKGFRDLAIATLSWISLAKRPLTLRELQCALSVEPGDIAMDEANFVDEETLSSACAGLIVVDHESRIVRLAHYTTQEYFESQKDALFLDRQNLLAETCLTYLSFNVFSNWRFDDRGSGPPNSSAFEYYRRWADSHAYPLLNYAARHWHEHAHSSQDPTVQRLVIEFLERTENLTPLLCCMDLAHKKLLLQEPLFTQRIHGLLIAARYGFTDAVKALLHLEGYCAEDRSRIKAQALNLAAICGQSPALRILLDDNTIAVSDALKTLCSQVHRYQRDNTMPPGYCEGVEILLNHGAEPNTALDGRPLIHHACGSNDVQFASLLLSHGADVELRDWKGRTALHHVAGAGHSGDIVKLLLKNKLDINARNGRGETALLTAVACFFLNSEEDHRSLITQLLGSGASVDRSDNRGRTALHRAAAHGVVKIACRLLEAGADVKARNCKGRTAADCLDQWNWCYITEDERVECEEILERYSFYQSGEKISV